MRFKIGITGEGEVPSEFYSQEGQELIFKLCQGPVLKKEISAELLKIFKGANALREDGEQCYLNFTCFLKEDIHFLNQKCGELGEILAEKIKKETNNCLPLKFKFDEANEKKYLFFIAGCICLDWHGLIILEELDLIAGRNNLKKTGYGHYFLFANENGGNNIKELYWGSHNYKFGDFCFTTFGDHAGQRKAFPDLLNINNSNKIFMKIYSNMLQHYMPEVGRVLAKQSEPDELMLKILTELKYIKDGQLNIPVVVYEDIKYIRQFMNILDKTIKSWLINNSGEFIKYFKELTPIKSGVDFKEVLIQIWHYIFGHTNKHLSRNGYFFNPYSDESDFDGYLPVVHENKCDLLCFEQI